MAKMDFPPEITIPYQWFVDAGMYSNAQNAKRSIDVLREPIISVRMKSEVATREGKLTAGPASDMFYHCDPQKNGVRILANREFNWNIICEYFTVYPHFIFELNINAFNLTQYIFYLARQNIDNITKEGNLFFSISMKSISEQLGLPPVDKVNHRLYKQNIIKPIEDAIEEIEEKTKTDPASQNLSLAFGINVPDTNDINEWLSFGKLDVILGGSFTKKFSEISRKAEEARHKAGEMKEITEKAKAREAGKIAARQEAASQKKTQK